MSLLPYMGAYVVVSLDPVKSVEQIDDDIVQEQARALECGKYVAAATWELHPLGAFTAQRTLIWDFVTQGLPPKDPETGFEPYMTVPIHPNTLHPESRRPVETLPPLPWDNCYHASIHRLDSAMCVTKEIDADPQSCFSPPESQVIDAYLEADLGYATRVRRAKLAGEPAPEPHFVSANVLRMIRMANKWRREDGKPWWLITREDAQANMARRALEGDSTCEEDNGAAFQAPDDAEQPSEPAANIMPDDLPTHEAASASPPVPNANASASAPSESSYESDFKDVVAGILLGINTASSNLPWLYVESYDIRQFDAPPDPTGFFEELKKLEKIKTDYVERQKARLKEVQRQDAEYIASIEARGRAGKPRHRSLLVKKLSCLPFVKSAKFLRARLARSISIPSDSPESEKVRSGSRWSRILPLCKGTSKNAVPTVL
ncbi:uncharacterized protein SCHCODRAFT_02541155 [Schizophyllum commune H4-8]|uniref:Expressed protein n=1 Tax=Schizophyllum commune (strain H4-8 / FGSC 9210) TaxID=578458 RepID=D8Q606_SCHCM|nr:uncharacterized protein SCHCODRAFT_02541155 [Schizophyllum commune H4-8]KAI5891940.1 hypothetical protein SCHCODRAFT_02541155 [Schizophyllum commune H4-8]